MRKFNSNCTHPGCEINDLISCNMNLIKVS